MNTVMLVHYLYINDKIIDLYKQTLYYKKNLTDNFIFKSKMTDIAAIVLIWNWTGLLTNHATISASIVSHALFYNYVHCTCWTCQLYMDLECRKNITQSVIINYMRFFYHNIFISYENLVSSRTFRYIEIEHSVLRFQT